MMNFIDFIPLFIWGFLVGFVGWGSCFRLGEPVGDWLISAKKNVSIVKGWTRAFIIIFVIMLILVLLTVLPMLVLLLDDISQEKRLDQWRTLYGTTFFGSLVGVFIFGLMSRIGSD